VYQGLVFAACLDSDNDQPDTRPGIEPCVNKPKLGRVGLDEYGGRARRECDARERLDPQATIVRPRRCGHGARLRRQPLVFSGGRTAFLGMRKSLRASWSHAPTSRSPAW
jgi:hypothetical protein